jgi:hypothetical protein
MKMSDYVKQPASISVKGRFLGNGERCSHCLPSQGAISVGTCGGYNPALHLEDAANGREGIRIGGFTGGKELSPGWGDNLCGLGVRVVLSCQISAKISFGRNKPDNRRTKSVAIAKIWR